MKRAELETNPSMLPGQIVNHITESMLYKPTHGGYPEASPCRCQQPPAGDFCDGCPYATVNS